MYYVEKTRVIQPPLSISRFKTHVSDSDAQVPVLASTAMSDMTASISYGLPSTIDKHSRTRYSIGTHSHLPPVLVVKNSQVQKSRRCSQHNGPDSYGFFHTLTLKLCISKNAVLLSLLNQASVLGHSCRRLHLNCGCANGLHVIHVRR